MSNFVKRRTEAEILGDSLVLMRRHFEPLFLIAFLAGIPGAMVRAYTESDAEITQLEFAVELLVVFAASALAGVAIALVLLSRELPDGARRDWSFGAVFKGGIDRVMTTLAIHLIVLLLGYFMLVIPGIVFTFWFYFAEFIALIEGNSGWPAMRRAKQLSDGRQWQTALRIILVLVIFALVPQIVISLVAQLLVGLELPDVLLTLSVLAMSGILVALAWTGHTLILLDLYAEKEGADDDLLGTRLAGNLPPVED